jgi:serine protease
MYFGLLHLLLAKLLIMKKTLLTAYIILCAFVGFSQKANSKYVDGIIYFQLKPHVKQFIYADAEGRTSLKSFSFLGDFVTKYGVTEIKKSFYMAKDEGLLRTYKVFFNDIYSVEKLIQDLEKQGVVEYAEKLPIFKLSYVPNDQYYNYTTNFSGYTLNWKWHLDKIKASLAWDISTGSSAIRVAVTDNAVFTSHPDLQSKIVAMRDEGDSDNDPNPPATATGTLAYEWSHGTHVAGLIGAQSNNSIGIASIGFNVSVVAVKIGRNSDGALISGYEGVTWASTTGQSDVINMSWGGPTGGTTAQNVINAAYAQGCVLIAAAGNDGLNGNPTFYPAAFTNVIAVGATNSDDTKADFSEYGTWVDVCAPGGNQLIGGQYFTPLVSTTFNNTIGLNSFYGIPNSTFGNGKYDGMQGTSMASPIVAGLAGLILSVNPAMTQAQVRNCIVNTADNINALNTSFTGQFGSGRINAQAALQCAQSSASVAPTPAFTGNPLIVCPGSTITFSNQTVSATSYTWTFQGGTPASSTSTATSINVVYNTPGVYNVTLTASNAYGSNSTVKTGYITVLTSATLPLVEGFQSTTFPPVNWYQVDAGGNNIQWQQSSTVGYNSTKSALFDNFNNDETGRRDELRTYVNLSGYSSAKMTFYRSYAPFSSPYSDTLQIGISSNCGSSITYPWLKGGAQLQTANATSTNTAFSPTTATQWQKDSVDLTPYIGQSNVMITFINRASYGNSLFLDNINITGVVATTPTAAITSASTGCTGVPITLTNASTGGASSWLWTMAGGTPTTATTQNTSVTYTTAGVKTITLTVANGTGTNTVTKTITITATPSVTASITNTTICRGSSVIENLTGATTYTWLPSGTGNSSTLTPTVTTIYTITGSSGGCTSAVRNVTITVTPNPTVNISASSSTICTGQTASLTASGAATYAWLPGALTTTVISVTPTTTTIYTVTGTTAGCSSNKTITVNVTSTPTISASITNTTICRGTSVVVTTTGTAAYTWLPSGSGNSSTLTPTATTIYTVTGSNGSCLSAPKSFTINVIPTPTTNVLPSSATICAGQTATLTASGAATYAWLPGGQTTTVVAVSPNSNTTYTVTGSTGGCSSNRTITINVSTTPTITPSITNTTICAGSAAVVSLTGAVTYTWLPSGSGISTTLSPTSLTIYTVTGANGSCVSTPKTFTINVTPSPTVNATASSSLICAGTSSSLTATGATSYTWSPATTLSAANGSVVAASPTITTTYTVIGLSGTCSNTKTITLTVSTCTGIENLNPLNSISVFPNPSNGLFTISNSMNSKKLELVVTNAIGQLIISETALDAAQLQIDLTKMSKGFYYLKVSTDEGAKSFKLILE